MCCAGAEKENDEDRLDNQPKLPWEGSDRDYTYQELLGKWSLHTCRLASLQLRASNRVQHTRNETT